MTKYEVYCRSCGCIMRLRNGRFGEFYGCTGFPYCKQTLNKRDAAINYILEDDDPEIKEDWGD